MPERRACEVRIAALAFLAGLVSFLLLQPTGPANALEYGQGILSWFPPVEWIDSASAEVVPASALVPEDAASASAPEVILAEEFPLGDVDIRLTDLLASDWALHSIAPRQATEGIGTNVEQDLFLDGEPRGSEHLGPAEEDSSLLY